VNFDGVIIDAAAHYQAFDPDTVPESRAAATERFAASFFSQIAEGLGKVRLWRQRA
jgi:hypothetical protein